MNLKYYICVYEALIFEQSYLKLKVYYDFNESILIKSQKYKSVTKIAVSNSFFCQNIEANFSSNSKKKVHHFVSFVIRISVKLILPHLELFAFLVLTLP